jgi:thiamine biosynthesis lipoprotein
LKQTRILMGMPITLEIVDPGAPLSIFERVFDYFDSIDQKFSTYKDQSEISRINRRELALEQSSPDMQLVFDLCEQMRLETGGYFDIQRDGYFDPSGLVKGWAAWNAAELVRQEGFVNFYVDAGGDIQTSGKNARAQSWRVGIRNPFNLHEIVKVLSLGDCGVATSGTSIRGQHIYNPYSASSTIDDILSLTVIGSDVYYADCFATAAFAMGKEGIRFIEDLDGFEGYMIDNLRQATYTSGFLRYVSTDETNR